MTDRRAQDQARNRSKEGKLRLTYRNQLRCSTDRGHPPPNYSVDELGTWATANGFDALHSTWEASGYERFLSPSFDRKNNELPYSLDNLQLGTWRENLLAQKAMNKDGTCVPKTAKAVNQFTLSGEFIQRFESAAMALRAMVGHNKSISNITQVCAGKLLTAYGYKWQFADEPEKTT